MFHLNKRVKHWVNISDYMPLHCDPVITSAITCLYTVTQYYETNAPYT